jgi:hypothetical protein
MQEGLLSTYGIKSIEIARPLARSFYVFDEIQINGRINVRALIITDLQWFDMVDPFGALYWG